MSNSKEKFKEIFEKNITRDGAKELLEFLEKTDFFVSPASTQFHSAYEGGLCDHSINVYNRFLNSVKNEYGKKYLDINAIGKSRAIAEVCGQIIMFRSLQKEEKEKIKVWKHKRDEKTGKLLQTTETVKLDPDKDYICLFIVKNRYGRSNVQLVYERNMAFNTYIEIGFTEVEYDGFGR